MADLTYEQDGDRVIITLDPRQPIELSDLSKSFAALARMYERHYRASGGDAPKLYVTRLETGSIIMEIAPMAPLLGVHLLDNAIIVADFTNRIWRAIKAFSSPIDGPIKIEPPSNEDAADIREFAKPLLGKNGAALRIGHARYEKTTGDKTTVVEYNFNEAELNRAALNIERQLDDPALIEKHEEAIKSPKFHSEVMLFLDQANRGPGKQRGRTGDRGAIPAISDRVVPV
jgi:hypothetical protein